MGFIRKESTVSKAADLAAKVAVKAVPGKALKSGAAAVGAAVGLSMLSAVVSQVRRRQEDA